METTQLVQQNGESQTATLTTTTTSTNTNGGFDTLPLNGDCNGSNVNGDCETNKMLTKGEAIELSTSQANIKCCNGFFAARNNMNKKKKIVKESSNSNGTSNGKCHFSLFKEKLSNGKHTQLIDENCDNLGKPQVVVEKTKKVKQPMVFDDRDPFKINSNVKFEYVNLFAEPNSGTYSFNPTWSFTSRMYFNLKLFLYRLFAILIGIPSAFVCAIVFAVFSVVQIWIVAPILRLFKALFGIFREVWMTIIDAVFGPIFQTIAVAFRGDYSSRCSSSASSKSIYNEEVNVV